MFRKAAAAMIAANDRLSELARAESCILGDLRCQQRSMLDEATAILAANEAAPAATKGQFSRRECDADR